MGLSQGLFGDGLLLFSYFLWLSFCALPSTELQLRRHLHGWLTFICVFIFSRPVHLIAVSFAFCAAGCLRGRRRWGRFESFHQPGIFPVPLRIIGQTWRVGCCFTALLALGRKDPAAELRAQSELHVSGCAGQWVPRAWKLNMSTLAAVKRGGWGEGWLGGQDGFSRIERERDWDVTAPDYKIICADLPSLWSWYCVCESLMPKEDERTGVIQPIAPVMAYVMFPSLAKNKGKNKT